MERNPNDPYNSQTGTGTNTGGSGAGTTGSSGLGAAGSTGNTGLGGTAGYADTAGADTMRSTDMGSTDMGSQGGMNQQGRTGQMKDQARQRLGDAREKVGQAGEKARDWKQRAEHGLAERLEQGANRLRERTQNRGGNNMGQPAYAGADGGTATATDERMSGAGQNLANGMEKTADWLRNGDLQGSIEDQARTNPGRTLLIALGVGYLLGKALRR